MMISSCQRSKVKGQSIKVSKFLSRARLKRLLGLSVVCALGLGLVSVCLGGRLWLNPTASVPPGLYLLSKIDTDAGDAPLQTGDLVLACLPWEAAALGRERGYLLPGSCPGGSSPVGKYVAARAGSEITVDASGVRVDGAYLPHSRPQTADAEGRALRHAGGGRLRDDEFWLWSPHPQSYDSRYSGPVKSAALYGRLKPLWLWGS